MAGDSLLFISSEGTKRLIIMNDSKFYMDTFRSHRGVEDISINKVNKRVNILVNGEYMWEPAILVTVARRTPTVDTVPKSSESMKVKRITEDTFTEYFDRNYASLQKMNIRGGDYYVEIESYYEMYSFHGFIDNPRLHCIICCQQTIANSEFTISCEHSFSKRPTIKQRGRRISEDIFCKVYKLVLEFFYEGSAMPSLQDNLYNAIQVLVGPDSKEMQVVINQDSYYQKARKLMVKRKEEIKSRLIELDDSPSTRRVLRAQIKAIDYCIYVLDSNH